MALGGGTFLAERNSEQFGPVVVIGAAIHKKLFPKGSNPVCEYLLIGGKPFLIKGLLSRFGGPDSAIDDWRDSQVSVPIGTGQSLLFGTTGLDSIMVYAQDPKRLGETARAVNDLLVRRHGRLGFAVRGDIAMRGGFATVERLLSAFIGAVGAISLFVGGMGVASVMLVSVTDALWCSDRARGQK